MGDPELAADVAWPDSLVGQLHNALPHHVRQRTAVHKHAAQLIHATMTCTAERCQGIENTRSGTLSVHNM